MPDISTEALLERKAIKIMILDYVNKYAITDRIAVTQYRYNQNLSYKDLWEGSESLAAFLLEKRKEKDLDSRPIVVIGHKDVDMVIAFIAAIKTGVAYCPIDIYSPADRINDVLEAIEPHFVIIPERNREIPEGVNFGNAQIIDSEMLHSFFNEYADENIAKSNYLKPDDTMYILFTSGSTGKPKGVQVMLKNLESEAEWICGLGTEFEHSETQTTHINQAPFTFDLSIMDLYSTLRAGRRLWLIDKQSTESYEQLMKNLEASEATTWHSTPSFVEMCLADPTFNKTLMPKLETFLMCGEVLANRTAESMIDRFESKVFNLYGPTETIAVTGINVTKETLSKYNPLPIGYAKKGNWIEIKGEQKEIVILGETVGAGYYKNKEKTEEKFSEQIVDGKTIRSYKTGDSGYIDENGLVFFKGRIDTQIKLHGHRIELEDIESNIAKLPYISRAVVIPKYREGRVASLLAKVVVEETEYKEMSKLEFSKNAKKDLLQYLPEYMIPKSFQIIEELIMTPNGKVDRRKMAE